MAGYGSETRVLRFYRPCLPLAGGYMRFIIGNAAAALILLLSALALQQTVRAQASLTGNSSVGGYVFDETRRPLSQVVVELRNEYNSVIARTRTQNSGQY